MRKQKGRPLGKNSAKTKEAERFFEAAEKRGLSLMELHKKLLNALGESKCPSYRTLQEWRRGTYTPYFAPFDDWRERIAGA